MPDKSTADKSTQTNLRVGLAIKEAEKRALQAEEGTASKLLELLAQLERDNLRNIKEGDETPPSTKEQRAFQNTSGLFAYRQFPSTPEEKRMETPAPTNSPSTPR